MPLASKRTTRLLALVLMVALASAAALLATSAPTFADPPCDSDSTTPDCLAITSVSPEPGAKDVAVGPVGGNFASADFNQNITSDKLAKAIRVKNLDLAQGGVNVSDTVSYFIPEYVLRVIPNTYVGGQPVFECGTTYKVRVGGGPLSGQVRSDSGQEISEVPAGVNLKDGVARWRFTTEACP